MSQSKPYITGNYTIQCKDVVSGQTGCFLFNIPHWQQTGEFKAISAVFPDLYSFFGWCRTNGNPQRESSKIERI